MGEATRLFWSVLRITGVTRCLTDWQFMRLQYRCLTGQTLNLATPVNFNEKLQWLKLHYRNPLYVVGADKYEVRKLVAQRIGTQYLPKCLGVFKNVDDINFDALPQKFVLKATHGSGWNVICPDKDKLNWCLAKKKLRRWLKQDFFKNGREWQYHEIKPRIVCEEFLEDPDYPMLRDYKLFTFKGETKYIWVDFTEPVVGRSVEDIQKEVGYAKPKISNGLVRYRNIYDPQWNFMQGRGSLHPCKDSKAQKRPECLEEMIALAKKLAYDFPLCRVDFYVIGGKRVVFGELTFTSANGCNAFYPQSFNDELGSYIELPETNK